MAAALLGIISCIGKGTWHKGLRKPLPREASVAFVKQFQVTRCPIPALTANWGNPQISGCLWNAALAVCVKFGDPVTAYRAIRVAKGGRNRFGGGRRQRPPRPFAAAAAMIGSGCGGIDGRRASSRTPTGRRRALARTPHAESLPRQDAAPPAADIAAPFPTCS